MNKFSSFTLITLGPNGTLPGNDLEILQDYLAKTRPEINLFLTGDREPEMSSTNETARTIVTGRQEAGRFQQYAFFNDMRDIEKAQTFMNRIRKVMEIAEFKGDDLWKKADAGLHIIIDQFHGRNPVHLALIANCCITNAVTACWTDVDAGDQPALRPGDVAKITHGKYELTTMETMRRLTPVM